MSAPRQRILLLGGTGQIGGELRRMLAPLGEVVSPTRAELDLREPARLRDAVRSIRPWSIVNAAAYTAVDAAEQEAALAATLNAEAPAVLAEEAARAGAVFVHYSTDYVFDGTARRPYVEDDATGPLNVYGETKLAGERRIEESGGRHLVLRTSWVYGLRGHNFLRTIRQLAREREELRVVDDQTGTPNWSRSIAEATAAILARIAVGDGAVAWGTYHLSGSGSTTRHRFAEAIVASDPSASSHRCRVVTPIRSADFPTPARRPSYSVLDSSRIQSAFGVSLPAWETQLAAVMGELAATERASSGGL